MDEILGCLKWEGYRQQAIVSNLFITRYHENYPDDINEIDCMCRTWIFEHCIFCAAVLEGLEPVQICQELQQDDSFVVVQLSIGKQIDCSSSYLNMVSRKLIANSWRWSCVRFHRIRRNLLNFSTTKPLHLIKDSSCEAEFKLLLDTSAENSFVAAIVVARPQQGRRVANCCRPPSLKVRRKMARALLLAAH